MDGRTGAEGGVGTGAPSGDPYGPPPGERPADGGRPPLRRPREGRIVAGVAAGLSDHLDIDVAIVRILLVVITIVTSGVALLGYLAAILLIPAAEPGAPRVVASSRGGVGTPRDPLFWVGVGLLVVGALWLIGGPLSGVGPRATGLLGELAVPLVLIAFGLALWRAGERRSAPPAAAPPPGTPGPYGPAAPPSTGGAPSWTPATGPTGGWGPAAPPPASTRPTPSVPPTSAPQWAATTEPVVTTDVAAPTASTTPTRAGAPTDPGAPHDHPAGGDAGAAAGTASWETVPMSRSAGGAQPPPPAETSWPGDEPAWTPPPAPSRQRSLLTRVTLGLSLVTAGVLWILRAAEVLWPTWGQIAAASLLVLGLGLLVGSVAGRARWLLLPAALLAPIVLAWQIASPWATADLGSPVGSALSAIMDGRPSGEIREVPTDVDQVLPSYELGAGSVSLDLTELELDGETVSTSIEIGAGEIVVFVPDDAEVVARARSGIGEVDLFGTDRSAGINPGQRSATREPDDAEGRIELDLDAGLGEVRVEVVDLG